MRATSRNAFRTEPPVYLMSCALPGIASWLVFVVWLCLPRENGFGWALVLIPAVLFLFVVSAMSSLVALFLVGPWRVRLIVLATNASFPAWVYLYLLALRRAYVAV